MIEVHLSSGCREAEVCDGRQIGVEAGVHHNWRPGQGAILVDHLHDRGFIARRHEAMGFVHSMITRTHNSLACSCSEMHHDCLEASLQMQYWDFQEPPSCLILHIVAARDSIESAPSRRRQAQCRQYGGTRTLQSSGPAAPAGCRRGSTNRLQ